MTRYKYGHPTHELTFSPVWSRNSFRWLAPETLTEVPEIEFLNRLATFRHVGGVAVDVGAHCGFYSVLLARLYTEVLAFEPSKYQRSLLRKNLKLNHCANVQVVSSALGSKRGKAELHVMGRSGGTNTLRDVRLEEPPMVSYRVPIRRLDDFRIDKVGFLKIDVEGFESEVIEGASTTLRRDRPTILLESNPASDARERVISQLYGHGYEEFQVVSDERPDMLLFGDLE